MLKKITLTLIVSFTLLFIKTTLNAQSNVKYGPDYVVFEAEDTNTPLGSLWTVREPSDTGYLEYLFYPNGSPDPFNDTYFEYTGPWQGAGSELEYKFTCPKTGTYQVAMRLHTPLRESNNPNKGKWLTPPGETVPVWWELADLRNDFFIKMEGNFTSGSTVHSEADLRTFHKFFGRGANRWGTAINLEHNGNHGVFYDLIEGEEYTFFLKGRSNSAIVDYITFYDTSYLPHNINNQSPDLALQLPEKIRPYAMPTAMSLNPSPGDLRIGTSSQLETIMTPTNGNPNATWSSSNSNVLVDQNGVITANGTAGQTATITATNTLNNTLIATSDITLVAFFNIPVTSVSVSPESTVIVENESETLVANIIPADADNKNVTWSSSDITIATVDQNGTVTGVMEGTVKIRATSNENNAIFDEADVQIGQLIPQAVSIDKINGMTVDAFKTLRSNQIEIGEVLSLEITHSNITEFNTSGSGRLVVRYAINNGGTAVGPNLNIDNIAVGAAETTQMVNYTVANHNTANNPEPAVLQIFAAQNFGGINKLYSGFQIVPAGSLSTQDFNKNKLTSYYSADKNAIVVTDNIVGDYSIYNLMGQLILNGEVSKEINVNSLKSGIYILSIEEGYLKFAK